MNASQIAYKKEKKAKGEWGQHRGDRTEQSQRYRDRYPERHRVNVRVYRALQSGELKKPKWCQDCGDRPVDVAHHKDYSKPLEVDWLCWRCHNKLRKKVA